MSWLDRVYASPINYYGGFALDVVVATILIAWGGAVPGAIAAGLVTYTFYEYVVHRWIYHRRGTAQRLHAMHHESKTTQFGAPFFMTMTIAAFSYAVAGTITAPQTAASFAGAILASYALQSVVHHIAHGWSGTARLRLGIVRACRRRHMLHHRDDDANFGILTSFWDRVFRTHDPC